ALAAGRSRCRAGCRLHHLLRPSADRAPPVLLRQAAAALTGGGFDGISVTIGGLLRIGGASGRLARGPPVPPLSKKRHGTGRAVVVGVAQPTRPCQHGTCRAVRVGGMTDHRAALSADRTEAIMQATRDLAL